MPPSRHPAAVFPPGPGYRIVEHTADFGLAGRAADLPGLFRVMAEALFALILGLGEGTAGAGSPEAASPPPAPEAVHGPVRREIRLGAASHADLLRDWLQDLNELHQIHGEVYRRFDCRLSGCELRAVVAGEAVDPESSPVQHEVKGVTWHELELSRDGQGWRAYVLLDV